MEPPPGARVNFPSYRAVYISLIYIRADRVFRIQHSQDISKQTVPALASERGRARLPSTAGIPGSLRDPMAEFTRTGCRRGFTWILATRYLERAALWRIHTLV